MTQSSSNNSSKPKVSIIVVIVALLVAFVGYFFYLNNSIEEEIKANEDNTFALPQSVKKIITSNNIRELEKQTPSNQPVNFSKYIYLRKGMNISESGERFYYEFDTPMNEKLNTLENASASDIDGIILYRLHTETVGYYEKDDLFSNIASAIGTNEKDGQDSNSKKAMKLCVVLSYVSIPDGTVLKSDSIWGAEPPSKIKKTENAGIGSLPDNDEIVKAIKNTIQ